MDTQYHQFGSSERTSGNEEPKINTKPVFTGMNIIVIYILYGILVLLLLILLMVTGIKFSQLNKEIAKIGRISQGGTSEPSSSEQVAYLEKLVPERGSCRSGWVFFQRSCYKLSDTAVAWSRAEELCKTDGGHLVVLNNVEELDFLSRIVENHSSYWIGLVERQNEGHWSWVDGTDFNSTPTFWDAGQPDNWDYIENGEDCGQLHPTQNRQRKRWNDADCNLKCRYICEAMV